LDEEKSKHAGLAQQKSKHASLAQQNGSGPAFLHSLLRLVNGIAKPHTCC
jgi:hypothetical protein